MQDMTRDQLKQLLREVPNPRWRLALLVGFWHGLRASEIITLKGSNIRDGFVTVQRLKGSLRTIQPFVQHDDPELDESKSLTVLAGSAKANETLFPITRNGLYRLMQRAGARAGLPKHKLHPHALKHSIAMQTIQEAGIQNVRQWLGHRSIASTGAYLRVSDTAAGLAIGAAMGASQKVSL